MRTDHLTLLVCPACRQELEFTANSQTSGDRVEEGGLRCKGCAAEYPILRGVPRFVPLDNEASSFGFEWMRHPRTQYDSHNGTHISEERFYNVTRWPRDLRGELMLEVGSGSGRFTEIAAATGAMVCSLDYSYAVDANYASNGHKDNVLIVQANLYQMPFREASFDRLFCFGVTQSTPDVKKTFMTLPPYLKSGGSLALDCYFRFTGFPGAIFQAILPKYIVRRFTRHMNHAKLYRWVERYINLTWPISRQISRIPRYGRKLNFLLMIADYRGLLPLSEEQLKEWAILDTFDMLSPLYDDPQSVETVNRWLLESGLKQVEAHRGYNGVEGRGIRP